MAIEDAFRDGGTGSVGPGFFPRAGGSWAGFFAKVVEVL